MPGRLRSLSCLTLLWLALALAAACGSGGGAGVAPALIGVSPATGTVGTIVSIAGSSFQQAGTEAIPVNPTVTFTPAAGGQGFTATVTSFSASGLEVAVPPVALSLAGDGTLFDVTVANPGGGSAVLRGAFRMSIPAIVAVNGGLAGSGTAGSLFILDGQGFGDLAAPPAPGLPYSVDFRDATSGAILATAAVDFAAGNWQDIFIVATVPSVLAASATPYQLTVTTPSGTSAPARFLVVASVTFSPSTIAWSPTSALPVPQQGFPTVLVPVGATTFAYVLGGNTATSSTAQGTAQNVATVSFAPLDAATGALAGAWTATTPLPAPRGFASAVAANAFDSLVPGNGNLYVLGGLDASGQASDTVYVASLAADGTVPPPPPPGDGSSTTATSGSATTPAPSTWTLLPTRLPQPLSGASAVLFHGRVYLAGGNDVAGAPVASVYSARIRADGTLDPWITLPDLPAKVAFHQLVTSAGYLYVLGGDGASVDPITNVAASSEQSAIYASPIQIRSGALAAWTVNPNPLGKAREKFSATVAGPLLLVSGGLYNGAASGSSEQSYATLLPDGSIAPFNGATGSHTISGSASGYSFFNHSSAYFVDASGKPHVLILGGQDVTTGSLHDGVWYQH